MSSDMLTTELCDQDINFLKKCTHLRINYCIVNNVWSKEDIEVKSVWNDKLNTVWLNHKKNEHLYLHSNAEARKLSCEYFIEFKNKMNNL